MNVSPVRSTLHAVALQHDDQRRERFAAVGDEVHRAGQARPAAAAWCARTMPTTDAAGHAAGLASNVRGGARLLQRRQPRGQLLGQFDLDARDVRLAAHGSRRVGELRVEARTIGAARLPARGDRELRFERKALAARRPRTGSTRSRSRPAAPETIAVICCAAQLVGLNMNPGRSMLTVTRCRRSGTPKTICGTAYGPVSSVVIVSVEVSGSTSIRARTTTRPRLNGPATACVTMLNPNGAPS